jgi:hypothetical protein
VLRQIPGILTHDGGLSYVVDVVLSMLLRWEEFRSFSLASVGLPREKARASALTASAVPTKVTPRLYSTQSEPNANLLGVA